MLSRTLDLQEQSSDLSLLNAYLQQLVGQQFLQIRFSYGDEVTLHFGTPRPYSSPALKGTVRGSYVVGAMASACFLASPPQLIKPGLTGVSALTAGYTLVTPEQPELIRSIPDYFQVVEAYSFITGPAQEQGFGLFLRLDNASGMSSSMSAHRVLNHLPVKDPVSIVVVPQADGDDLEIEDEALADWEVMTPNGRYLRVGPSLEWSYLPSH